MELKTGSVDTLIICRILFTLLHPLGKVTNKLTSYTPEFVKLLETFCPLITTPSSNIHLYVAPAILIFVPPLNAVAVPANCTGWFLHTFIFPFTSGLEFAVSKIAVIFGHPGPQTTLASQP